ncbi:hypothetical protein L195_g049452, partial [Trifolium pratense]
MYGAAFKNLNQPSHVNCSQCADSRTSETATLPAAPANAIATSSFAPSIRARSKCLVFALYSSFEALSVAFTSCAYARSTSRSAVALLSFLLSITSGGFDMDDGTSELIKARILEEDQGDPRVGQIWSLSLQGKA